MHSTSRVTWLVRTSATLAGRLILRLRSTLLLRERKPLRAVQRRTGNDPASRLGRSLSTCRRAMHRLVGLGRSPASHALPLRLAEHAISERRVKAFGFPLNAPARGHYGYSIVGDSLTSDSGQRLLQL